MKDLTTAQIESLEQLIEEQNTDRVRDLIKDLHPADIAELFQDLDLHDAEWVFNLIDDKDVQADVLMELD